MGSNEIRLRKQKLSPGRIAHHRNYADLMRKHRRGLKTKQLLLLAVYIIVVLLLIILSFIAIRVQKNKEGKSANILIEKKHISISSQMPLPWSDEQFSFSPDHTKT
jgi:uncharacterized membrane protein YvbJ